MTYRQQQQYRKLQAKVADAYKAFQENTDPAKKEKLADAWVKALYAEDAYYSKYAA